MEKGKKYDDIIIAQKIVSNGFRAKSNKTFHEMSRIYRGTNEFMTAPSYYNNLKDKEKVLSVIGSGDQIINSILMGSEYITGYDISIFPKYYLMLKLAAIKTLTKEEYINFFLGRIGKELLNYDIYEKVRENLDKEYVDFWDSLFDYFDEYEINDSPLFSNEVMNRIIFEHNNPYLRGENYDKMKSKINNINIRLLEGNIFKLLKQEREKYDLINLSNIIQYSKETFNGIGKNALLEYKNFLKSLPLNENGIALSYIFGINSFFKKSNVFDDMFNEECFTIEPFINNTIGDGILIYQKKK